MFAKEAFIDFGRTVLAIQQCLFCLSDVFTSNILFTINTIDRYNGSFPVSHPFRKITKK